MSDAGADDPDRGQDAITRRQALAAGAGVAATGVLVACGGNSGPGSSSAPVAPASTSGGTGGGSAGPACRLAAEAEEGPFYLDLGEVRTAIAEDRPGVPLALAITVLDATGCEPLPDAAVDVWHCDALGAYSGVESEGTIGETYLRGIALTDDRGVAEFETIYPGHYPGRTTHLHLKVRLGGRDAEGGYSGGNVSYVGQLYTPEPDDSEVFALAPYAESSAAIVPQSADGLFTAQDGASSILTTTRRGADLAVAGIRGEIAVGVDPAAVPG